MEKKKRIHAKVKSKLHPRNRHRQRYDFDTLIKSCPDLAPFVKPNKYDDLSVDFFDPRAVRMLNKAILIHFYDVNYWEFPNEFLCPPIPGRADYIHYMADCLENDNIAVKNTATKINCLDIGVGASCIYPIIGSYEYDWNFVGTEINESAVNSAKEIVLNNDRLKGKVVIKYQKDKMKILEDIISEEDDFHLTICNPPFYSSANEAKEHSNRKLTNLKRGKTKNMKSNFGGQNDELWYPEGELGFANRLIRESKTYSKSCLWFSTLISKQAHLKELYPALRKVGAVKVKTIDMGQGNKVSRILAWRF